MFARIGHWTEDAIDARKSAKKAAKKKKKEELYKWPFWEDIFLTGPTWEGDYQLFERGMPLISHIPSCELVFFS